MANYIDNYNMNTALSVEDFEAELLVLPQQGGFDDVFDFTLDGSSRFERMFGGADDFDPMFTDDSILSAPMVKQSSQCESMQVDSIQEMGSRCKNKKNISPRRSSKRKSQVELNVSNFHPAPYNPENNPSTSSCSDLSNLEVSSTCSAHTNSRSRKVPRRRFTLDSPHAPILAQLLGYGSISGVQQESSPAENMAQYQKSLQKGHAYHP